jgi:hypothetical protein
VAQAKARVARMLKAFGRPGARFVEPTGEDIS